MKILIFGARTPTLAELAQIFSYFQVSDSHSVLILWLEIEHCVQNCIHH